MAATRRNHSDGSTKVICDKCLAEAHGPVGKLHRKCKDRKLGDKGTKGTWQKG